MRKQSNSVLNPGASSVRELLYEPAADNSESYINIRVHRLREWRWDAFEFLSILSDKRRSQCLPGLCQRATGSSDVRDSRHQVGEELFPDFEHCFAVQDGTVAADDRVKVQRFGRIKRSNPFVRGCVRQGGRSVVQGVARNQYFCVRHIDKQIAIRMR